MQIASRVVSRKRRSLASFTLIELLVVIAIIAILVGLTLAAAGGVIQHAARSRANSEVYAISTKLEDYKADNGAYPSTAAVALTTNSPGYSATDGSVAGGLYQQSSQALFMALTGKTNFLDTPVAGVKSYLPLRANQVGNAATPAGTAPSATTSSYIMDPWGYSYGYSTGTGSAVTTPYYPYNGNYNYDLWSTGGVLASKLATAGNAYLTNAWISNFHQ
jgi:prepilin-type N-terminal cleavage/methylation domain-containing protein